MTTEPLDTTPAAPQMRSITIEIPTIIAQKMAETFDGTLEDATLTGLRLIHGMGTPTYTKLQVLAKQREISLAKAIREAIGLLESHITNPRSGANPIGRPKVNEARDAAIYTQVNNGHTYAEVSAAFQLSLVRVGQIVAQQRAMRGVVPRADLAVRNADILRRVEAGESRHDVAASHGITRGVVDNIMAMHLAKNPKAIPVMPAKPNPHAEPQPETFKVKTPDEQPSEAQADEQPKEPRYVMPSLAALKAKQAEPVDTRTAKERDVYDPEFGF